MRLRLFLLLAVIGLAASALGAETPEWRAGVASVKITPDGPVWMAGYAARDKPSEGVAQDLYAKALVLQDATDHTLVLVTLDLISVPGPLREFVVQHLAETRGLKPDSVLLNCSHTHCGPEIRTTGTALAGLEPERKARSLAYLESLQQRLISVIDQAFATLAPAQLAFQKARAGFAMNRRLPRDGQYVNHPNPDGRVDHDVPVLSVLDESGKRRAVLFGYACHNTTLSFYQICGDYAGYAQEYLEAAHPDTIAMFLMGCGGDQNPYPRRELEMAQQHGRTLAMAVEAAWTTREKVVHGPLRTAFATAELEYATPPSRDELLERAESSNKYERKYAQRLLEELDDKGGLRVSYPAPVQVVRFGNDVLLVALPGETVVDYSLRLKRELAADDAEVWVAGYCNDVFAYIPSLRVLQEGGYEAGGAMRYMTTVVQPGPFAPDVEQRLMETTNALIEQTRPQ